MTRRLCRKQIEVPAREPNPYGDWHTPPRGFNIYVRCQREDKHEPPCCAHQTTGTTFVFNEKEETT